MGLFDRFKKSDADPLTIYAPISGKVIPLEQLADKTFSSKIMGDGVAIIPSEGKIFAPVNGTISALLDTKHAYGVTAEGGYELLVHIGQDTVNLKGEGFTTKAKQDKKIKKGELLGTFDIDFIKKSGYEIATPVIVMQGDYKIKTRTEATEVKAGDVLFTVSK
ncbi:MAG: PTS glucose transporter subunit IIA [Bacilli bacterium]|nr:PTS glucose transporter subunit IIA [Bacilli bacterium]